MTLYFYVQIFDELVKRLFIGNEFVLFTNPSILNGIDYKHDFRNAKPLPKVEARRRKV